LSYLLDTNTVIAILNRRPLTVRDRWIAAGSAGARVATSTIVIYELLAGAHKSGRSADNIARIETLMTSSLEILDFTREDADAAGQVRVAIEAKGTPIGPYDILIAGQAIRHGLTVVTANVREFQRVPHLMVEDWGKLQPSAP
jgi:tRNA(fMet)-specific endonuclease VapC